MWSLMLTGRRWLGAVVSDGAMPGCRAREAAKPDAACRLNCGCMPPHLAGIGDWGSSLRAQRGLGATSPAVHA
jgi:hypothetical protein